MPVWFQASVFVLLFWNIDRMFDAVYKLKPAVFSMSSIDEDHTGKKSIEGEIHACNDRCQHECVVSVVVVF